MIEDGPLADVGWIDLKCLACGYVFHIDEAAPGVWAKAHVTPEHLAEVLYCPVCGKRQLDLVALYWPGTPPRWD